MSPQLQIEMFLKELGIEPAAAKIYIELATLGHSSALQLAKKTSVSRTQVYRYLESLQSHSLVSSEQLSYGTLFRALPLQNLEAALIEREAQAKTLHMELGNMTDLLQHVAGTTGPRANVQHYYGLAGLKQANWNLTKADKEFRVFEAAHISQHLDKTFARRHREQVMHRKLVSYDLTNDTSVRAVDLEPFHPKRAFVRHIDPNILTINFEVYIYNDVITLLDYSSDNPHAIEIHHPTLHAMMRQIFEAMWSLAKPLNIT